MNRSLAIIVCGLAWNTSGAVAQTRNGGAIGVTVRLTSPISSRANHRGDRVAAIVLAPETLNGDSLEGVIEEAKSSGDVKKTSTLWFTFKTLTHEGKSIPVSADVRRFWNSKGQGGVDEEGRVVKASSGLGKVALATLIGGGLGAALGGAKGAAIGAGAGLAAGFLLVSIGVKGPEISFGAQSTFELALRRCDHCIGPEDQTLDVREFANDRFSFWYPRHWVPSSNAGTPVVSVAPPDGEVRQPNGQTEIGFGVMVGMYSPAHVGNSDLAGTTAELIRALQTDSPGLQVLAQGQEVAAGDVRLYIVGMGSTSPFDGGRELDLLVTMMRPEGLFYLIGIGPVSRATEVQQFSLRILQSLRFLN